MYSRGSRGILENPWTSTSGESILGIIFAMCMKCLSRVAPSVLAMVGAERNGGCTYGGRKSPTLSVIARWYTLLHFIDSPRCTEVAQLKVGFANQSVSQPASQSVNSKKTIFTCIL